MPAFLHPVMIPPLLLALVAAVGAGGESSAVPAPALGPPIELTGRAFGTSYTVKMVPTVSGMVAEDAQGRIEKLLDEIDAQMSLWRDDSELSRFNRFRDDGWFDVSPATARVIAAAIEISQVTGGAFDPTVSPLVQLWSFGPQQQPLEVPTAAAIAEARRHVGISLIDVRLSPPAVRKHDPDVRLDLNAIAKGDAVDRVARLINGFDPAGYMVEIGGEVRARGTKADGSPWGIGIEQPTVERRIVRSVIKLKDAALATSGDYRNFIEIDGRRYSHTIDPRTGHPIDHALAAVSVVADDCMTADAWATALMVLGTKEGLAVAESRGIEALFLTRQEDGFAARTTPGFPPTRRLAEGSDSAPPPRDSSRRALGTFLLTALVFGIAIAFMAAGVMFSNRRLRGTCGGLSGLKDEHGNPLCDACTHPSEECEELRKQAASAPNGGGASDQDEGHSESASR